MACPTCGVRCTCAPEADASTRTTLLDSDAVSETDLAHEQPALDGLGEEWRQEVASRVDAFCARRGRKRVPRTPSLSLDFERAARATAAAHYAVPEPQAEPTPTPAPQAETSNIIEFPRLPTALPPHLEPVPYADELAEPILVTPRILDAEEPSGLLFGGESRPAITLESAPEPEADDDAGPIGECASLARRIVASTLDAVIIAIAIALFATVFLHMAGTLPRSRMALLMAIGLPALFWGIYQYLFLVHAAATPGMRVTSLRLRTFDGQPARRSLRRWRAIAMMISALALGLGFLWASVDEYGLCWHDRITRTALRRC